MARAGIFYLYIFLLALASLLYAHIFLQNYLFMKPCEQCVYIRFAMSLVCIFSLFCMIVYRFKILFFLALSLLIFGIFLGFYHSFLLLEIYTAIEQNNPFGVGSCSNSPNFAFNLALERYFPHFFGASGICGIDAPQVPDDVNLSKIQEFFVGSKDTNFTDGLYSKGWFLLPNLNFLTMPSATLILFSFISLLLLRAIFSHKEKILVLLTSLSALILATLLFYLA